MSPRGRRRPAAELDDATRPVVQMTGAALTPHQARRGRHLVDVHDMYRRELGQVRKAVVADVAAGRIKPAELRQVVNDMSMRQTYRKLGSFCAAFCQLVENHHSIESAQMFPALRRVHAPLAPVLDRLELEHQGIHRLLVELDTAILAMVHEPSQFPALQEQFERLADTLLSHFRYEESQLVDPLGRFGVI